MAKEKMWTELARHYDKIYKWKDYKKEAERVHYIIQKLKKTNGRELLDVACGTGNHIQYLKKHYSITGIDLNKGMLDAARKKFPRNRFLQADMADFRIKKEFDAIVCLFSAIAYTKDYNTLKKTLKNFSKHTKKGGVIVIEPFIHLDEFMKGSVLMHTVDEPGLKLVRIGSSMKKRNLAHLDFRFLIATKKGIEYIEDKHTLGLFRPEKVVKMLSEIGFSAKFLKNGLMKGRGLYVAVKK